MPLILPTVPSLNAMSALLYKDTSLIYSMRDCEKQASDRR